MLVLKSPNGNSDGNTQYDTALTQVGRDEVKARMKEMESELARAEQTSALREEVFCLFLRYKSTLKKKKFFEQTSELREEVSTSCASQSSFFQFVLQFFKRKHLHSERRSTTCMLNSWSQSFVPSIPVGMNVCQLACSYVQF